MAVIVTGMDMPDDCLVCPLHTEYMSNVICRKTGSKIGITCAFYERMNDCPLKSVDGLIEKIEDKYERTWMSDYRGGHIDGCLESIKEIKEYCGLEE